MALADFFRAPQPAAPRRATVSSPTGSLTAAAERVVYANAQELPRLAQPWQQKSFEFYNSIGEIHYAGQFYARALSQLRTFVARVEDDGEIEPLEIGQPGFDLLEPLKDPGGGTSRWKGSYGRLKFLVGEGIMFGTQPNENLPQRWEFLSGNEIRVNSDNTYTRFLAPGLQPVTYRACDPSTLDPGLGEAVALRMWTPDPQFSYMADSSMKGVIGECEELLLLTLVVAARAKNRLQNGGILLLNQDLNFGSADSLNDENPNKNPFQERLQMTAMAAIRDPGSAGAVVPLVVTVPGNIIGEGAEVQAMRLLKFSDNEDYRERELREELIGRIAQGLDMPPEMLKGLADTNHWNAWQISDETWNAHLKPVAQSMCDDLTSAYLRQSAVIQGVDEPESLVVGYDAAEIISRPDRFKDAQLAWDRGAIGYAALREAGGWNEHDEQDEEEHAEYLARVLTDPLQLPDNVGAEGEAQAVPQAEVSQEVSMAPPDEALMDANSQDDANVNASGLNGNSAYIVGLSQGTFYRARELAGARIRAKVVDGVGNADTCPDCNTAIDGVDNHLVASLLGRESVEALGYRDARALVAGAARTFGTAAEGFGMDGIQARKLGTVIEDYAARTLFDSDPGSLPERFSDYLEGVLRR